MNVQTIAARSVVYSLKTWRNISDRASRPQSMSMSGTPFSGRSSVRRRSTARGVGVGAGREEQEAAGGADGRAAARGRWLALMGVSQDLRRVLFRSRWSPYH